MAATSTIPVHPGTGWMGLHLNVMSHAPLKVFALGARTGEDVLRLALGPLKAYVVYGPSAVRQVLVEHPERFGRDTRGQALLRRTLGLSVLTSEGDEWRWRRRMHQPSFKREALAAFDRPIVRAACRSADAMLAEGGAVDVSQAMSDLALHVACEVLFGDDLGEDAPVVHRTLTAILKGYLPLTTALLPQADRLPLPAAIRYRAARAELAGVVERIVARRRNRTEAAPDLLGRWLEATRPDGRPLTPEDLDAEGVTMLLAGHETTANALAFGLGLLARHPSVLRRVVTELAEVLGDRVATNADLDQLPVLDAVVKETLRLYPPAWMVSRSANEDVEVGGHRLPKGAFLFVPVHAIHRLPACWDQPEGFDPDRWLDGRAEPARKAGAYLPFGLGQRRCIGEHLGMMEAKLVLATLLRALRIELLPGQDLDPEVSVTLRPRGGLWMSVRPAAVLPSPAASSFSSAGRCPYHAAAEAK